MAKLENAVAQLARLQSDQVELKSACDQGEPAWQENLQSDQVELK